MPKENPAADKFVKAVGRRIFELRRKAELTQALLAEQIDVSTPYQARVEGGTENLTLKTLHKYALAFGVRPHQLLLTPRSTKVKKGRPRSKKSTAR